jgi:NAD(P)-dependent dehydrogenase (short-subunit alcohol dehydrogenase family)
MRRIAIITEGASGIGATIGRALVVRGHHVVLADIQHETGPWWWMWRLAPPFALRFAVDLTRQARRMIEETTTAA